MKEQTYQANPISQFDFKNRIVVPEYIDNLEIGGKKLEHTLWELEWVNKYLGGMNISVLPVIRYVKQNPDKIFTWSILVAEPEIC